MSDEKIEITYIAKAVDNATKILEKVDKSASSLKKSMEDTAKATKSVEKEQKSLSNIINKMSVTADAATNTIKNFYDALVNFDFKKLVRILRIIAFLLKFKGLDKTGNMLSDVANKIEFFGVKVGEAQKKVEEFKKEYGGLLGYLYKKTGLKAIVDTFKNVALSVAGASIAFVGLASSAKATNFVVETMGKLDAKWIGINQRMAAASGQMISYNQIMGGANQKMSLFQKTMAKLHTASSKTFDAFRGGREALVGTNKAMASAAFHSKILVKDSIKLAKTTLKASMATEFAQKGFYAFASQAAALGGGLALLGKTLLDTDSVILKFAGTLTLGLAVALGFTAYVLKSFIGVLGSFIEKIGNNMVQALDAAVQKFQKFADVTASYNFLMTNLNAVTDGATGSIGMWGVEIEKVSGKTGYSIGELRKATSEMVRLGNAFHLSKNQMKELLPVITDIAAANHDDLFSTAMRVTEAIGGMTQATAKYGIVLSAETLLHSKAYKTLGKKLSQLSEAEKAQLRFKVMLEKTAVVQGYAAASLNTYAGAQRVATTATEKMNISLGQGASVFETVFLTQQSMAIDLLSKFGDTMLAVIGFFGSFLGRGLQIAGMLTQWSFAIILVITSYKALNILLGSQVLRKWTLQLAKSTLVTKHLAGVSADAAKMVRTQLIATAGTMKSTNTVTKMLALGFRGLAVAVWASLKPILIWAAPIIGAIVAIRGLYLAMVLIEEKSKVFTHIGNALSEWWNSAGIIDAVSAALGRFGDMLVSGVAEGVKWVAYLLIHLGKKLIEIKTYIELVVTIWKWQWEKIVAITTWVSGKVVAFITWMFEKIVSFGKWAFNALWGFIEPVRKKVGEFFDLVVDKFSALIKVASKAASAVANFGKKIWSALTFGSAYAADGVTGYVKTQKILGKETDTLSGKLGKVINKNKDYVDSLTELQGKLWEVNDATKASKPEDNHEVEAIREKYSLMAAMAAAETARKDEVVAMEDLKLKMLLDERLAKELLFLEESLGQKEAIKAMAEVESMLREAELLKTKEERQKKHLEIITKINANHAKGSAKMEADRIKKQKDSIYHFEKFETLTNRAKIARTKAVLGSISTLQGQKNKELFMVGKAAALANAYIDVSAGVMKAWAMGPILGAILAPIVAVAGALQIGKIATAKPPAYYNSGVLEGNAVGDQQTFRGNGGETILNTGDASNLLDIARFGNSNSGGNAEIAASLESLAAAIRSQPVVVEVDGREIARTVRSEMSEGFMLA